MLLSQQRSGRFADRSKSGALQTVQSVSCCRLCSGRPGRRTPDMLALRKNKKPLALRAGSRPLPACPKALRIAGLTELCNQSTPNQPVSMFTECSLYQPTTASGRTGVSNVKSGNESGVREPGDAPRRRSAGPSIRSQEKQQAVRSGEALDSESSPGRGQHGSAPGPAAALETSLDNPSGNRFQRGFGGGSPREKPFPHSLAAPVQPDLPNGPCRRPSAP